MAIQDIISAAVFLLFIQKGIYSLLTIYTIRHARNMFFLSLFFACWALSDVVLPLPEYRDAFGPLDPVALLGWSILPLFMNQAFSHLINHPTKTPDKRAEMLVIALAGAPLALAALGNWIPGIGNVPLFSATGPWPYFLGVVLLVNAFYLLRKVHAWHARKDRQYISFRLVILPLLLFLLVSLLLEFAFPLTIGPTFQASTPLPGILWFALLVHGMKQYDRAMVNPGRSAPEVIQKMELPVFLCNADKTLFDMNPAAGGLFGPAAYPRKGDCLPARFQEPDKVEAGFMEAVEKGSSGPVDVFLSAAGGASIPLSAKIYLLRDGFNDVHGFAMVCRDLRLERQLEDGIRTAKEKISEISDHGLMLKEALARQNATLAKVTRELQVKFSEGLRMEEKIEMDLFERDILINEIHNRVIYNMHLTTSLIRSQDTDSFPQAFRQKLLEMAQRVRSILLVHQHLYLSVNYSEVDFKGFLQTLADELLEFYGLHGQVEVDMDLADDFLDIHKAIPLGIIANELVSNSLVHAWKGNPEAGPKGAKKLKIGFSRKTKGWRLVIADNGTGLPGGLQAGEGETIGLPLVGILANDQVGARLRLSPGKGTRFHIEF